MKTKEEIEIIEGKMRRRTVNKKERILNCLSFSLGILLATLFVMLLPKGGLIQTFLIFLGFGLIIFHVFYDQYLYGKRKNEG